jgi:hypothetical protein
MNDEPRREREGIARKEEKREQKKIYILKTVLAVHAGHNIYNTRKAKRQGKRRRGNYLHPHHLPVLRLCCVCDSRKVYRTEIELFELIASCKSCVNCNLHKLVQGIYNTQLLPLSLGSNWKQDF